MFLLPFCRALSCTCSVGNVESLEQLAQSERHPESFARMTGSERLFQNNAR